MSIPKKRELLPKLNKLIQKLISLSSDVAILELHDQDQASKRVRIALLDFKNIDLEDFRNEICNVRIGVNKSKGRKDTRKEKPTMDLKVNQNNNY